MNLVGMELVPDAKNFKPSKKIPFNIIVDGGSGIIFLCEREIRGGANDDTG